MAKNREYKAEEFKPKEIDECCRVNMVLCGTAKKKVVAYQAEYFKKHGRYIGKKRAINRILEGNDI